MTKTNISKKLEKAHKEVFKKVEKVFRDLACDNGYAYVGKSGSGHFVKLIHNGIEYALLQSYGEGFEVLKNLS